MADYTYTEADIRILSSETPAPNLRLGEVCEGGRFVYQHTDGKYYKADCTDSGKHLVKYYLLYGGDLDDYVSGLDVQGAIIDPGGTALSKTGYALSTNGLMMPVADWSAGKFMSLVGFGNADGNLILGIFNSGVQI